MDDQKPEPISASQGEFGTVAERSQRIRSGDVSPSSSVKKSKRQILGSTLLLNSSAAVYHCVLFPSSDPDEIADLAAMQMEGESPLEPSQMVFSHEILTSSEDSSLVLCAAAPVSSIQEAASKRGFAPLRVRRVDVAALAMAKLLADKGESAEAGLQPVVFPEGSEITLLLLFDRKPVAVSSMRPPSEEGAAAAKLAAAIRLQLVQAALVAGNAPPAPLLLAGGDSSPQNLAGTVASAAQACGLGWKQISSGSPSELDESALERTKDGEPFNLLPEAWKASQDFRRRLFLYGAAAAAGLLLWLAAAAYLFIWPVRLEKKRDALAAELSAGTPAENHALDLRDRAFIIHRYSDRTFSLLEVLREASLVLPDDVEFTRFSYEKEKATASLDCLSRSDSTAFAFADILKESDIFANATVHDGPRNDSATGKKFYTIHLDFLPEATNSIPAAAGGGQ